MGYFVFSVLYKYNYLLINQELFTLHAKAEHHNQK